MVGHASSQPLIVKAACKSGAGRKPDASTFEAPRLNIQQKNWKIILLSYSTAIKSIEEYTNSKRIIRKIVGTLYLLLMINELIQDTDK